MALTNSVSLTNGIVLENAYIKISEIEYSNHSAIDSFAIISVNIYKDKDARDANLPEVIKGEYKVTGDAFTTYLGLNVLNQEGKNLISQGYEYLKTLAYYQGATDVIDAKEV